MSNENAENQLAEKRRINRLHELAEEMERQLVPFGHIMQEVMMELRCTPADFFGIVMGRVGVEAKAVMESIAPMMFSAMPTEPTRSHDPYATLIDRLLKEAPAMEGAANQTAAVDLQIRLRSGKEMIGALAYAPEGSIEAPIYRFLVMGKHESRVIAVEHYFHISDIEYVAVLKAEAAAAPSQTIIMG